VKVVGATSSEGFLVIVTTITTTIIIIITVMLEAIMTIITITNTRHSETSYPTNPDRLLHWKEIFIALTGHHEF